MKQGTFTNPSNGRTIRVHIADSFGTRLAGLMFRRPLPPATGLLITPCNSIHMCFMRFAIDAVYLDEQGKILKVARHLRPWIGLSACWPAKSVLELTAGQADALGLQTGQTFIFQEKNKSQAR